MSKKATEFQRREMSRMYRGKEIFKPLNTGWIDEHVACVREWVANIFFYRKGETTIMIDAGYNYDRLAEKMSWLGIDPASIRHILITHQDTDHVGAVEADSPGLFRQATLYIGEVENRYLTGEARRRVIYRLYKLPQVTIDNKKVLLKDGQVITIGGVKIECFLTPGHTGWTDDFEFAFAYRDKLCSPFRKRVHDPNAPYDAYDESDDTRERAQAGLLTGVGRRKGGRA